MQEYDTSLDTWKRRGLLPMCLGPSVRPSVGTGDQRHQHHGRGKHRIPKSQWDQGRSALKKTRGRSQPRPWQWSVWPSSHSEAHHPPQGHVNCTHPVSRTPFGELTGEEVENLESQGLCGGEQAHEMNSRLMHGWFSLLPSKLFTSQPQVLTL